MFLSRNTDVSDCIITVGDIDIKASDSINILGIDLDKDLKFQIQVDEICSQSGKQINALERIDNIQTKALGEQYTTVISTVVSTSAHQLGCSQTNAILTNVKRQKKRELRFVTGANHLSYDEMCKKEKIINISRKCVKAAAILLYKIKKDMAPKYVTEMFTPYESNYDMRDANKFVLPQFNTVRYGKNSFKYYGAKLWNNIPLAIKNSSSLNTFKSAISNWLLTCDDKQISLQNETTLYL